MEVIFFIFKCFFLFYFHLISFSFLCTSSFSNFLINLIFTIPFTILLLYLSIVLFLIVEIYFCSLQKEDKTIAVAWKKNSLLRSFFFFKWPSSSLCVCVFSFPFAPFLAFVLFLSFYSSIRSFSSLRIDELLSILFSFSFFYTIALADSFSWQIDQQK